MLVTRVSQLTGVEHTLDLPVTQDQMDEFNAPRHQRRYVQDIFPNLSASQREFLLTGMTDDEWDVMFGDVDEEIVAGGEE